MLASLGRIETIGSAAIEKAITVMPISPTAQPSASRAPLSARVFAVLAVLLCGLLALSAGSVYAQTLSGSVRVTPAVAAANQPRTITFSGVGYNGCTPIAGPLRAEPALDPKVITMELLYPPTFAPCTQALTPYETTFTFTPPREGNLVVLAKFANEVIGVGSLIVGEARPSGPLNLSGMWIDWSRPASMVHLSQSEATGSINGILGAYKSDGTPTWWLIHSSRQTGENTFDAIVSEYVAEERYNCGPTVGFGLCDGLRVKQETVVGALRITRHSKDGISLSVSPNSNCLFTCTPRPNPLFGGSYSRFVF